MTTIDYLRTLAKTIEELDALVARLSSELDRAGVECEPEIKQEIRRLRAQVRMMYGVTNGHPPTSVPPRRRES